MVELLTGFAFLSLFNLGLEPAEFLFSAVFFSVLIFVAVYDWLHKIIPEEVVYLASVLSALFLLYKLGASGEIFWLDALAGVVLALPLAALTYLSGGRLMGLGDAKVMFPVGTFLGISGGLSSLILAFWLGAVFSLFFMGVGKIKALNFGDKPLTMKSEVPFAPFLVAGAFIVFVYHLDLISAELFLQ